MSNANLMELETCILDCIAFCERYPDSDQARFFALAAGLSARVVTRPDRAATRALRPGSEARSWTCVEPDPAMARSVAAIAQSGELGDRVDVEPILRPLIGQGFG